MNLKIKLLISIIFILMLFLTLGGISSFASTEMKVESTITYKDLDANNEIFITIDIKEFKDIGDGVNAYILNINFDNDKLVFVKAEGLNGWNSPTYNGTNLENGKIKFVATKSNFSKEVGEILKIILKTKNNLTASELNHISFEDISFANKINGSTQKLQIENVSLKLIDLNEKNTNQEPEEQQPSKQPETTEGENKDNDTAKGPLPQTGKYSLVMVFIILIITALFFYVKYKNVKYN